MIVVSTLYTFEYFQYFLRFSTPEVFFLLITLAYFEILVERLKF